MKKNRPGILLTCLCEMEEREKFTGLFFLHTSTRGVRYQVFRRAKLESTFETAQDLVRQYSHQKKFGYGIQKEAEFEDLKSVVLKNHCALSLMSREIPALKRAGDCTYRSLPHVFIFTVMNPSLQIFLFDHKHPDLTASSTPGHFFLYCSIKAAQRLEM